MKVHFILPATIRFLLLQTIEDYTLWSCQNVCAALSYLSDNIYIIFGNMLYRRIVGIPMGKNCAPLVADFFYFAMKEIS